MEVAAGFLVSRTGDADRVAARELAGRWAGCRWRWSRPPPTCRPAATPLGRYLPMFRARQADLLARGDVAGHPLDVAATLGLGLSRLAGEAPDAVALLRLLAFLAPEPVPLTLLLDTPSTDPAVAATVGQLLGDLVAVGDAVAALRRYSLVTPAGEGLVLVHRLVQAITRDQLPARSGQPVAAGRRRPGRGGGARRPAIARGLAGVRGVAVPCPGRPRPDQRRRLADRASSRLQRQLPGRPGPVPADRHRARRSRGLRPRAPRQPGRPRRTRPLDRGGGGCGPGPRPVRRAAAHQ